VIFSLLFGCSQPLGRDNFVESVYFSSDVGLITTLAVKDNYAYLTGAKALIVLDVSDKTNPILVSLIPSERHLIDTYVSDNYLYVGVGNLKFPNGGLKIFDISNPKEIKEIPNNLVLPETPVGIIVRDKIAYIGDYASGMVIVDVNNPNEPKILSNYTIAPPLDQNKYNEILNKAKTDYGGFKTDFAKKYSHLNITPEKMDAIVQEVGLDYIVKYLTILETNGSEPHTWWLTVKNNYAYISADADGMHIVDISDPINPKKVGQISKRGPNGEEYFFNSIALSGNYAFVAVDSHGMLVIDVSDPANPKEVKEVPAWSDTRWLKSGGHMVLSQVRGNILYLSATEDGLYIYDINNPTDPKLIQKVDKSVEKGKGTNWALAVDEPYIYTGYFDICANVNKCSSANPDAQYKPTGGFEIFKRIE